MKWSKIDFLNAKNHTIVFDESIVIQKDFFKKEHQIRDLKNINVSGTLRYDMDEELIHCDIEIEGTMILPCSLTLEDVEYDFTTESYETFSFVKHERMEDIHYCNKNQLELLQVVIQLISMEVPLRIVKETTNAYPKGEGWEVTSEEAYRKAEKPLDPRLAKFKEYKFNK